MLNYNEPADWFYPTRESLGAALLRAKRFPEAEQAFRDDLTRNPEERPVALRSVADDAGVAEGAGKTGRRGGRRSSSATPGSTRT